jgi:PKD repeat protein
MNHVSRPSGRTLARSLPAILLLALCLLAAGVLAVNAGPVDISADANATSEATLPMALPGSSSLPTDTDGDSLYDDVNGNGRADFADVVLYFNQMSWIAANEPKSFFDYNGNGRIDFADVVWLFNNL